MISGRSATQFLIQSAPGNVISLPQLQYKGPNQAHTIQVLNIHWGSRAETGQLQISIKLRNPFMLKISNNNLSMEDIVEKLNKAFNRYAKTNLFEVLPDKTIKVNVTEGQIFTNLPVLLRKKYDTVDDILKTELPAETFTCYNAKLGTSLEEPTKLRETLFCTEQTSGEYITQLIPDNLDAPASVLFGFQAAENTEEIFIFPLEYFTSLLSTKNQSQQLAHHISTVLNLSDHAIHYGFNFDIILNDSTLEFMCSQNTTDKVIFKSHFHIYDFEDSPTLPSEEWPVYLQTYFDPQMVIPPIVTFLPRFENPLTLHIAEGIDNSAFINQQYEKVLALLELHAGSLTILFAPTHPLISPYAMHRIPLELRDAKSRKIVGDLNVHVALT